MKHQLLSAVTIRKENSATHITGIVFYIRTTRFLRRSVPEILYTAYYTVPTDETIIQCTCDALKKELSDCVTQYYHADEK